MLIGSYLHLVIEGYITLPSGLIIQWGYDPREKADAAGHWMTAIFLKAFSRKCFYFNGNPRSKNSNSSIVFALNGNANWQLFAFGY